MKSRDGELKEAALGRASGKDIWDGLLNEFEQVFDERKRVVEDAADCKGKSR